MPMLWRWRAMTMAMSVPLARAARSTWIDTGDPLPPGHGHGDRAGVGGAAATTAVVAWPGAIARAAGGDLAPRRRNVRAGRRGLPGGRPARARGPATAPGGPWYRRGCRARHAGGGPAAGRRDRADRVMRYARSAFHSAMARFTDSNSVMLAARACRPARAGRQRDPARRAGHARRGDQAGGGSTPTSCS